MIQAPGIRCFEKIGFYRCVNGDGFLVLRYINKNFLNNILRCFAFNEQACISFQTWVMNFKKACKGFYLDFKWMYFIAFRHSLYFSTSRAVITKFMVWWNVSFISRFRNDMKRMKICIADSIHHLYFVSKHLTTPISMTVIMTSSVSLFTRKNQWNSITDGSFSLSLRPSGLVYDARKAFHWP